MTETMIESIRCIVAGWIIGGMIFFVVYFLQCIFKGVTSVTSESMLQKY